MIAQSIASAFDRLETIKIPGPWPGASGETWEIEICPLGCAAFQLALKKAEIKPRSIRDRSETTPDLDVASFVDQLTGAKSGKKSRKAVLGKLDDAQKAAAEAARRSAEDRRGIVAADFDLAQYPDNVLSLRELRELREAVAKHLVAGIAEMMALPAPSGSSFVERREWEPEEILAAFQSGATVPNVVEIPAAEEGEEPEIVALYLHGEEEGVALAAWVVKHAAMEHRFLERRVPLGSGSDSTPASEPIEERKPASGKSKERP